MRGKGVGGRTRVQKNEQQGDKRGVSSSLVASPLLTLLTLPHLVLANIVPFPLPQILEELLNLLPFQVVHGCHCVCELAERDLLIAVMVERPEHCRVLALLLPGRPNFVARVRILHPRQDVVHILLLGKGEEMEDELVHGEQAVLVLVDLVEEGQSGVLEAGTSVDGL